MKRTFAIILILALGVQVSSAKVIPVEKARQRAASFFSAAEVATRSVSPGDFNLLGSFPDIKTRSADEAPAMYIFERETGGYAIVSADDVARPVLAYSLNASFPSWDEIPENMMDMLQWYSDIIGFARSKGWAPFPETRANADLDPANTVQLNTAKWNQGAPFNNLVQEIDGNKPPIGCVATSIAIVMKYHEWPKKGVGELPAYDYTKNGVKYHIDGITLGHTYDWNLLHDYPDWYQYSFDPAPYTEEEATELSRLFYDVAVMCNTSFYPSGSTASSNSALKLSKYFGYDKSMLYLKQIRYRIDEWETLIKKDLNDGLPVIYSGMDDNPPGHAFVIDGYNGRYFSINYGLSGRTVYRKGHDTSTWIFYFTLCPIEGHEEDLLWYYQGQDAVFHIMPDKGMSPGIDALYYNTSVCIPYFQKGEPFTLNACPYNSSLFDISQVLRYVLFDKDGNVKELVSPQKELLIPPGDNNPYFQFTCKITSIIEEGDRLLLTAFDMGTKTWVPINTVRQGQVVFTKRQLSELVEIGYEKDYEFEDPFYKSYFTRELPFYMRLYKDICWELTRIADNKVLFSSNESLYSHNTQDFSFNGEMVDYFDLDNDMVMIRFGLPSGEYKLHVLNPATGETMDIDLEI